MGVRGQLDLRHPTRPPPARTPSAGALTTSSGGGAGDVAYVDLIKFPGGEAPAPRAIPSPEAVTIDVEVGGTANGELLVLNQGVEDLVWTLTDAAPNLGLDVSGGTLVPAGYEVVTLSADAIGLAEGSHQFNLTAGQQRSRQPIADGAGHLERGWQHLRGGGHAVGLRAHRRGAQSVQPPDHDPLQPAPDPERVLRLYDVQGRLVRELVDGVKPVGPNQVDWDGRDSSGRGRGLGHVLRASGVRRADQREVDGPGALIGRFLMTAE